MAITVFHKTVRYLFVRFGNTVKFPFCPRRHVRDKRLVLGIAKYRLVRARRKPTRWVNKINQIYK